MRYRLLLSVAALGALFGTHTFADVEITSDAVDTDGTTSQHTLSLTLGKAKVDTERSTIIIDANTGQVVTLMKARKAYMTFNAKELGARLSGAMAMMKQKLQYLPEAQRRQIEAMMAKQGMPGASGTAQPVHMTYESSGDSETVGSWSCRDFHQKKDGVLFADLCIAPLDQIGLTADDRDAFRSFATMMTKSMPDSIRREAAVTDLDEQAKQIGFVGMPVKTVIYLNGRRQITSTVKSIDHAPLPPDAFAIPAGYTHMAMPGFGGSAQ